MCAHNWSLSLIQIEKGPTKIIDADLSYQETLCKIQLPLIDKVMDQATKNYIMAIYSKQKSPSKQEH